ncbi:unnamed protein product [Tenebrio molitor]|nr:unnamed protein product [Tenebrio molitor]
MLIVLNVKRPYGIEFTRNISVNYKLGIQIVKIIYSVLCFFLRLEIILD